MITADTNNSLQITGSIATRADGADVSQLVVPEGATGVLLNVTALRPTADGFISVRPGTATGEPSASNLNFTAGAAIPNAVTVALPSDGTIDIWYGTGTAGATTGVLVDIVGYTAEATTGSGAAGPAGPVGPVGPEGPAGPAGAVAGFSTISDVNMQWTGNSQDVRSLDLPAGSFMLDASVMANNNSGDSESASCSLLADATTIAEGDTVRLNSNTLFGSRESLSLTAAVTLAAPATVRLVCIESTTSGNYLNQALTATQVSTLTES